MPLTLEARLFFMGLELQEMSESPQFVKIQERLRYTHNAYSEAIHRDISRYEANLILKRTRGFLNFVKEKYKDGWRNE